MSSGVDDRRQRIVKYLAGTEVASVAELGARLNVSEMTIRRDLAALSDRGDVRRVRGGALLAASARRYVGSKGASGDADDHPDVLILNPMDPRMARMIVQGVSGRDVPVVAESIPFEGSVALVAIDSFRAGLSLGTWVGEYARQHFGGEVRVLFVGLQSFTDTAERERGFFAGLARSVPEPELALSVNGQGVRGVSREVAIAALASYPDVNVIVGANDQSTLGALDAVKQLHLPLADVLLGTFGLEGMEGRRALVMECPRSVGVAMFPELIGRVCVDVAIRAHNGLALPEHVVTPVVVVTGLTLQDYYQQDSNGWSIRWDVVLGLLRQTGTGDVMIEGPSASPDLPRQIDFVRYLHDEYYDQLVTGIHERAEGFGIKVRVTDASADLAASIDGARQAIGKTAASLVRSGESVILDAGSTTSYVAKELARRKGESFTVITHSLSAFEELKDAEHITLISMGGIFHRPSGSFLVSQLSDELHRLRADKAFMGVTGLSVADGLSNMDLAQMDFKHWIIEAAKEVIVVADSYKVGQVALARIAPITAAQKVVTDDQISAHDRLALTQAGVDVVIAGR